MISILNLILISIFLYRTLEFFMSRFLGKRLLYCAVFIAAMVVSSPSFSDPTNEDPSFREKKDQEGYILNLKDLIEESKKKIEKVDDKLQEQAKLRRNQQREEQAREYYNKARRLFDEGNYEEAQDLWNKAIRITEHPEMKDYVSESSKRFSKKEQALTKEEGRRLKRLEIERGYTVKEVEEFYQSGITLFKQGKWIAAKDEFENVDEMFPDHKATRSYLMLIEQEIQQEQQHLIEEKLKTEEQERRKQKDLWKAELERREKERREKLEQQAEVLYAEGLRLYKDLKFTDAKERFKEVEWLLPNYKKTARYMAGIDEEIKKEERRQAELQQKELEDQMRAQRLAEEREAELRQKRIEKEAQEKQKRLEDEAEFIYETALGLYKKNMFEQAKAKFEETATMIENYKDVQEYLVRIDDDAKEYALRNKEEIKRLEEKRLEEERLAKIKEEEELQEQAEREAREKAEAFKKEIEKDYRTALSLYKKKYFEDAKEKFLDLNKRMPDYKDANVYLAKVDGEIAKKKQMMEARAEEEKKLEEERARKAQERIFEEETKGLYDSANSLYRKKMFDEARVKFLKVQERAANYKSTEKYLRRIDDAIQKQNNQVALKKEDDQKKIEPKKVEPKKEAVQKLESPVKKEVKSVERVAQASKNEEELIRQAEEGRRERFLGEAEQKYEQALNFYKNGDYENAKAKFIQVEAVYPGFKGTLNYLSKIDEEIRESASKSNVKSFKPIIDSSQEKPKKLEMLQKFEESKKSKKVAKNTIVTSVEEKINSKSIEVVDLTEDLYQKALRNYKDREYEGAYAQFQELSLKQSDYKDTDVYLKRIAQKLKKLNEDKENQKNNELCLRLYKEGEKLFKKEDFGEAKKRFLKVHEVLPGFRKTEKYLVKIDQKVLEAFMSEDVEVPQAVLLEQVSEQVVDSIEATEESFDEYEKRSKKRLAMIKAEEEQLEKMKGDRYEEFRRSLTEEKRALRRAAGERKVLAKKRRKDVARKIKDEKQRQKDLEKQLVEIQEKKENEFKAAQLLMEKQSEQIAEDMGGDASLIDHAQGKVIKKSAKKKDKEFLSEDRYLEQLEDRRKEAQAKLEELIALIDEEKSRLIEMRKERIEQERQRKQKEEEDLRQVQDAKIAAVVKEEEDVKNEIQAIDDYVQKVPESMDDYEYRNSRLEVDKEREIAQYESLRKEQEKVKKKLEKDLRRERKRIRKVLKVRTGEGLDRWKGDVSIIYDEAVKLYNIGNYEAAKVKFSMVENLHPGFRSARSYIHRTEKKILWARREIRETLDWKKEQERKRVAQEAKIEAERIRKEELDKKKLEEQKQKEEKMRLEEERLIEEKASKEKMKDDERKAEELRVEAERIRKEKLEKEKLEAEELRLEAERQKQEALEVERLDKENLKAEKIKAEELEKARIEKEKLIEDKKKEEELRLKAEREEAERIIKEKQKEEENVFKNQKELIREKARLEKEVRDEERKEAERIKREKERAEKEKAKLEERRRRQRQKIARNDIERLMVQFSDLYEQDQTELSDKKLNEINQILITEEFDARYMSKIHSSIDKEKYKIDRQKEELKQERAKEDRLREEMRLKEEQKREENRLKEEKERERIKEERERERLKAREEKETQRRRELEELEKKLKLEEAALQKERDEYEQKRLKEEAAKKQLLERNTKAKEDLKEKVKTIDEKKKVSSVEVKVESDASVTKEDSFSEKQKRLEGLVKARQEKLREERLQVQEEFERNIERLYLNAIKLFNAGLLDQAKRMFAEIETMKPDYKKTRSYLAQIARAKQSLQKESLVETEVKPLPVTPQKSRAELIAEALNAFGE